MADGHAPAAPGSPEYDPFSSVSDSALQDGLAKAGGHATPAEPPPCESMKRRRVDAGGVAPTSAPGVAGCPTMQAPPPQKMTMPGAPMLNMYQPVVQGYGPVPCGKGTLPPQAFAPMPMHQALVHQHLAAPYPCQPHLQPPQGVVPGPHGVHIPCVHPGCAVQCGLPFQCGQGGATMAAVPTCKSPTPAPGPAELSACRPKLVPSPPAHPPKPNPPETAAPEVKADTGTGDDDGAIDDQESWGNWHEAGTSSWSVKAPPVKEEVQTITDDDEDDAWDWSHYNDYSYEYGSNDKAESYYDSHGDEYYKGSQWNSKWEDTHADEPTDWGHYGQTSSSSSNYQKSSNKGTGKYRNQGKYLWKPTMNKGWEMKAAYLAQAYLDKNWERCSALVSRYLEC